jgi:hypothetical protein
MYEDRVLAFIDLLGTSAFINGTMENGVELEDQTKKIEHLFDDILGLFCSQTNLLNDTLTTCKTSHFSDTIVISCLKTEKSGVFRILFDVLRLCITALQNNFLLRGAIVSGKLVHTETTIFGPALQTACAMEKKLAIYPRVILNDGICKIAENYPTSSIVLKNHE